MAQKLIHKRSNALGKIPTGTTLDIGEIAVNYNANAPFLSIRNSNDTYSTFSSDIVIANEMAEQLKLKSDTGHTHDDRYYTETEVDAKIKAVNDTIEDNELTTSAALNDLNERVLNHTHGTVTLTGDVTGSASFGNRGATITTTIANNDIISVTYDGLVTLRNSSQLISGHQYRITDYVTTTSEVRTKSAGHPFDVIVLALSENTLAEEAYACQSEFNIERYKDSRCSTLGEGLTYIGTYEYNGTIYHQYESKSGYQMLVDFNNITKRESTSGTDFYPFVFWPSFTKHAQDNEWEDGESYGEDIAFRLDPRINYFTNNDISAWKLWYCLDNDTTRFTWSDTIYGKGVIYRMIDEFGNDCPYDFKNIQFKHPNNPDDTNWYYTFDTSSTDATVSSKLYCLLNTIKPYFANRVQELNYNIFIVSTSCIGNSFGNNCYRNSFRDNCYGNSFGDDCYSNSFGNNCYGNSFGYGCYSNSFGNYCRGNSFGNGCYSNSFGKYCNDNIFGNDCCNNSLGNECSGNSFGYGCDSNIFGTNCIGNSFGNTCQNNSFGNTCYSNSFGDGCYSNSFGEKYHRNSFGNGCYSNSFGNECQGNSFGNNCRGNSFDTNCQNNSFENGCESNIFGNECNGNSFGNNCRDNSFDINCNDNSFENGCESNSFGEYCSDNIFGNDCCNNSLGNWCQGNSFGNNCQGNSFGNYCRDNSFGTNCIGNSFGNNCYSNSFGNNCDSNSFRLNADETATLLNYCCYNHFDDGCKFNIIWNSVQPTYSNQLQNINVVRGVFGNSAVYNFINIVDKNSTYEIKVAKNSSGVIKVYCEADLIA